MGNGSKGSSGQWGYPFGHAIGSTANHLDLSNTQYALLGLRAAAGCGERISLSIWERCAQELLERQEDYGGFRYNGGHAPSASMTVAGMACLQICAEHIPESKRSIHNKIAAALLRGEQWLSSKLVGQPQPHPRKAPRTTPARRAGTTTTCTAWNASARSATSG